MRFSNSLSNSDRKPRQRREAATAAVFRDSVSKDRSAGVDSAPSIEKPPGHGADFIKG